MRHRAHLLIGAIAGCVTLAQTGLAGPLIPWAPTPRSGSMVVQVADIRVDAPIGGWQLQVPEGWAQALSDAADGATSTFTSPDQQVIVGVSTLTLPDAMETGAVLPMIEEGMMHGAAPHETKMVTINGTTGELRSYIWQTEAGWTAGYAFYARKGPQMHVVWGVVPEGMAATRSDEIFAVIGSYRNTVGAPRPAPLPDLGLLTPPPEGTAAPVLVPARPMELAALTIGSTLDAQGHVDRARVVFAPDAPSIRASASILGETRQGVLDIALFYVENGQEVAGYVADLTQVPAGPVVDLDLTVTRPDQGWPAGAYRVVVRQDGRDLGSRMMTVNEGGK